MSVLYQLLIFNSKIQNLIKIILHNYLFIIIIIK